jgi:hypothetical protein
MTRQQLEKIARLTRRKNTLEIPETFEERQRLIQQLEEKERHLMDEETRVQKARFFLEGLPYTVVQSLLSCEERDQRIQELLQKAGYVKAPISEASPASEPVPDPLSLISVEVEPVQPVQPQPRRLKL